MNDLNDPLPSLPSIEGSRLMELRHGLLPGSRNWTKWHKRIRRETARVNLSLNSTFTYIPIIETPQYSNETDEFMQEKQPQGDEDDVGFAIHRRIRMMT